MYIQLLYKCTCVHTLLCLHNENTIQSLFSNITKANPLYMDIEGVQDTTGLVDESAYKKTSYDDD